MSWPTPNDIAEALRDPAAAFADAALAAGEADADANGRPLALPGDVSAVYQVCGDDGRIWAVKCFTRPRPGLAERYAQVREALDRAALPCTVPFAFHPDGLRVNGQGYPIVKMEWVEGSLLNRVTSERADSPAVMDGLFKRWVQLCRELRAAEIAHTDLQHASAILVPGNWPGAYTLKLIDYDQVYTPAFAGAPADEPGHANYRHPARTADTPHSPDLDRFPHLVIATALKALAVCGPRLWKRYDTGDNLLFTAADFANPADSSLLRELWQSDNAGLRKLAGTLALACTRPLSQTPWLDDLAADLDVPLAGADAQAVTDLLGPAQPAVTEAAPAAVAPLAEAFTLDDEPEPAPAPKRAAPAQAVPTQAPKRAALKPLPLDDEPEGDEEERRSRPRKRRREPEPARGLPVVLLAVFAGLFLLGAGVAAGVYFAKRNKPDETTQTPPESSPANANPNTGPPVGGGPAPPDVRPDPKPPEPPAFAGPAEFHRLWARPIEDDRAAVKVFFAADGRTVFVANNQKFEALDAKTGNPRPEFRGPGLPTVVMNVWTLDRDRVVLHGFPLRAPGVWDGKTGEPLPAMFAQDPLPAPPPGVVNTAIECQLSPDGRYLFAGYQGQFRGGATGHGPAPYRVLDATTGKTLVAGDWTYGNVRFTNDGSRLLMAETNGRVKWLKMQTGETENEWAFQPNNYPRFIGGMSGDGSLFTYFGKPPGLQFDNYLIDGKTGQVLRKVPPGLNGDRGAISADGKWLVGATNDPNDLRRLAVLLTDARTGEVLVRTPIDGNLNDLQRVALTPDCKALVLHHRGKHEVAVYALRGQAPPETSMVAPAPLTAAPPRAPAGGAVGGLPDLPPPPPVPVRPGLPEAPDIKARWTVGNEAGIQANGLSQAPVYSKDGKTIVLSGGSAGTILTFDAKTGAAGVVFDGHKGPGGVNWMAPFADRVASGGFDAKQATWDMKTGKRVDDLKFPELPPLPDPMKGHAGITHTVSPGGRYTAVARKEAGNRPGMPVVAGPLRVLDTTTGKEVVSGDWNGGFVVFTADESRVFVLNGMGKAKWYKLPSGEADGEWNAGEIRPEQARVVGMTADGRTMIYYGQLPDQGFGVYLLDAKTGQMVRKLGGAPYQPLWSALSPDGKYAAMVVIDFNNGAKWYADVFEVSNWRLLGRITPPVKGERGPPQFGFSPDGKELAIFYPQAKELSVFPMPELPPR